MRAAVGQVASAGAQVDAVLVPDGPAALRALGPMLASAGVTTGGAQILGSGQWNDEAAWQVPELAGAWFAGPNPAGWQNLSARYQARFGTRPPRSASLAYDAVTLAAALSRIGAERLARHAHEPGRLRRRGRRVPLPPRRHERARAGDPAGRSGRGPRAPAGAVEFRQRDLISS